MKREYYRTIIVFEDHFKEFKKTLDVAVLKRKVRRLPQNKLM